MSELQFNLLIIGVVVVLAVYLYSWWQQRKCARKYKEAFDQTTTQEDALLSEEIESAVLIEKRKVEKPNPPLPAEPLLAELPPVEKVTKQAQSIDTKPAPVVDSACTLLDSATDYIALLTFEAPTDANSLTTLWKKRFDFVKTVFVCGLNETTNTWEKVTAESHSLYSAFKLCLQLADRSGPASEVNLSNFRDLVRDLASNLKAKADLPDVAAAHKRALALDNFCAGVDQIIGLNILPNGDRTFLGGEIERVVERHGMLFQADGAFHLADENGHTLFSLSNIENVPFQHQTLSQMWVTGLTLLMDVPRVEMPAQRFDEMTVLARQLALDLRAAVVDDQRVALGEPGFVQIHEQIAMIEKQMIAGKIIAGSAQARRLFS